MEAERPLEVNAPPGARVDARRLEHPVAAAAEHLRAMAISHEEDDAAHAREATSGVRRNRPVFLREVVDLRQAQSLQAAESW